MSDPAVARPTLADLEVVIERGLETFIEVGGALLEIRKERLYRDTHDTFELYCRDRWGFTDRRARQLIQAAELGTIVPSGPTNEGQARQLARLRDDPEAVREVWAGVRAEHGNDVTAADVKVAVDRRLGRAERQSPGAATASQAPTSRPEFVLPEQEEESEEERAYYALARLRLVIGFDPATVAATAADPGSALVGFEEWDAWLHAFMTALRERSGLRAVK